MKITHKQKVKLARKLLTKKEISEHTPIFQSQAWEQRKINKRKKFLRVKNKQV